MSRSCPVLGVCAALFVGASALQAAMIAPAPRGSLAGAWRLDDATGPAVALTLAAADDAVPPCNITPPTAADWDHRPAASGLEDLEKAAPSPTATVFDADGSTARRLENSWVMPELDDSDGILEDLSLALAHQAR
jgi:hypothetical protein